MIRVGTDIIEVARINRAVANWNVAFLVKVFTEREINAIDPADPFYERAAGYWAAKESMVKAIGYGFRDGIRFQDIEIQHDDYGCPHFNFTGRMKEIIADQGVSHIALSISHCRTHAVAVSVIS